MAHRADGFDGPAGAAQLEEVLDERAVLARELTRRVGGIAVGKWLDLHPEGAADVGLAAAEARAVQSLEDGDLGAGGQLARLHDLRDRADRARTVPPRGARAGSGLLPFCAAVRAARCGSLSTARVAVIPGRTTTSSSCRMGRSSEVSSAMFSLFGAAAEAIGSCGFGISIPGVWISEPRVPPRCAEASDQAHAVQTRRMDVEIWSDVVCPWCYIGKRRFEHALAEFDHRGEVNVTWRSFQLDPSAAPTSEGDPVERLAAKYGMSRATAEAAQARVTANAATVGLDFHLDRARSGNTFDAHRLIHYAKSAGKQDTLKERLMAAYFVEGAAIGEHETLTRLAVEVGLDEAAVREVLDGDAYADDVRHDELEARQLGITGVPFFVLDRAYGVSGAQPSETMLAALQQAWTAAHPLQMVGAGDGDTDLHRRKLRGLTSRDPSLKPAGGGPPARG